MQVFDKATFEKVFAAQLVELASAEKVTKQVLRDLSRTVLEAWHATGNVAYANNLIAILTPVNKKVCIAFFKRFSGFSYDEVSGMFTGKSKKRYENAHKECMEQLNDPHFNIWTWADKHIEVQEKEFDIESVSKFITKAWKKAQGQGLTQADILKAVFKGGIEVEAVVKALDDMGFERGEAKAE